MRRYVITFGLWYVVQHRFTDAERRTLNRAIVAEIDHPRGVTLDLDKVPEDLADRVDAALAAPRG